MTETEKKQAYTFWTHYPEGKKTLLLLRCHSNKQLSAIRDKKGIT